MGENLRKSLIKSIFLRKIWVNRGKLYYFIVPARIRKGKNGAKSCFFHLLKTRGKREKKTSEKAKNKEGFFMENKLKKAVSGVCIGGANAFFGGGGGMIAVPLLQKTGCSQKCAHATAILVILPVSALSFFFYAWKGFYQFSVLIPVAMGVSAGGFLGAKWLGKLPENAVQFVFAILQLLAGLSMFFSFGK